MNARTTYPGGKWKELVYDSTRAVTNILHTARSTPNTSFLHDAFGNITNAADTAGNSWLFSYASLNILTNEVFISPRLCDSVCQNNALARLTDTYSRPVGYDLAIDGSPHSRVRYGYDTEGRIATLAVTNAFNRGFQVSYLNEAGYNYGYTLTTPNGAILTRTVTRDPYRRSLTLDCTTRFNNVEVASFAYTLDAHNRPVARNNYRFAYNDRDEITSALIGYKTRFARGVPADVSYKVWGDMIHKGEKVGEKVAKKRVRRKIFKKIPLLGVVFLVGDVNAKGFKNGAINSVLDATPGIGWVKLIDEYLNGEWLPDLQQGGL